MFFPEGKHLDQAQEFNGYALVDSSLGYLIGCRYNTRLGVLEQDGRAANLEKKWFPRDFSHKKPTFSEKFLGCSGTEHFCLLLLEVLGDETGWGMDFLPISLLDLGCEFITFAYSQSIFDHKNQKFVSEEQNTAQSFKKAVPFF